MTADTFFCLEKYDSCCFTGHRVLPKSEEDRNILRDKLRSTIAQLAKEGIYRFYAGGARGFDSMAAMAVLEMKAYFPQIQLYLALPYPVLSMLTSSMAAYALARLRFRGRNVIFLLLISTMMIPGYVTLIPNFAIMVKLKLLNSHWALILRSALSGSATSIFLFRQFFLSIPRDLENAAIVDGCSWPGVFFRIIMPNSKPAIATVIILSFRSTWNSFLWPQLVLQTDRLWTWTLALKILSESETNQAVLLAGSVISILPILIIYLACQKYFVNSQVSAGFGGT